MLYVDQVVRASESEEKKSTLSKFIAFWTAEEGIDDNRMVDIDFDIIYENILRWVLNFLSFLRKLN